MIERGKFIVLYGANNLGKSLQTELLQKSFKKGGQKVERVKYPVYDLKPTGPEINAVLREGKALPEQEVQRLYAQNRRDFESKLRSYLDKGIWVVAEDYTGTGIAWGLVRGVLLRDLEEMNADLLREDLAILLYGERFLQGKEVHHRNENDDKIWQEAQRQHLFLADRYGWKKVYATRTPEAVHSEILEVVEELRHKYE